MMMMMMVMMTGMFLVMVVMMVIMISKDFVDSRFFVLVGLHSEGIVCSLVIIRRHDDGKTT